MKTNKILTNLSAKRYFWSTIVFLILQIINILFVCSVEYSFYVYLLILGIVLGYYVLKETKFFKSWIILATSLFWSSALLILLSGLLAMLSVPIESWILYIPSILLIPLLITKPISIKGLKIRPERDGIILLLFTLISLVAHVYSVRDFIAPILHDPISHATWAKQIYDTGLINYFYSPGLHILAALGKMADGVYISKYILIITNIFNALTFIPVYLFVKSYFKDRKFALITVTLFLILKFPSAFFWTMGKNSLVLGIGFMFLLFWVSTLDMSRIKKLLIMNSLVLVIILIHYPVAFITLIGLFFLLISQKGTWRNLQHIIIGSGLGIVWGLMKMQYEIEEIEESVTSSSTLEFTLEEVITFLKNIYTQVAKGIFFDFPFGEYLVGFGLLGLAVMLVISIGEKKYLWFMLIPIANIVSMYFIEFIDVLSPLHIVYSTQILVFFVFIYIGVGFLFAKMILPFILERVRVFLHIFLIIVVGLVFYSNYQIYIKYRESQASLNMVQESDIKAYEWMKDNLEKDVVILNNAQVGNREDIVYASDAGAWIPVFAGLEVAMPFTDFNTVNTHENYKHYINIRNGEFTCVDIDNLLERKIKYYYQGSKGIFGSQLELSTSNNFKLIYSEGPVRIFEIVPCK